MQESYDRTVVAKNSLEEDVKEMVEAIAHYESQIAEIIQWYVKVKQPVFCA